MSAGIRHCAFVSLTGSRGDIRIDPSITLDIQTVQPRRNRIKFRVPGTSRTRDQIPATTAIIQYALEHDGTGSRIGQCETATNRSKTFVSLPTAVRSHAGIQVRPTLYIQTMQCRYRANQPIKGRANTRISGG